ECLSKKYPGLKVAFAESGGEVDDDGQSSTIKVTPVDILFVAFGHIKQEKWIAANFKNIPVKIAMGVGGSFDYLSGLVHRAPKWVRDRGFEWLFRLIIQPWRIKRQLAIFKYLWLLTK
ncbi:MAG: WecB/TagA/CpsF family glycosyltransferase, partial [Candidatus Daviesbacteria bacterium]|nr:WecB/TagA/CpsF family glycosyltransferase [Candidatus Daviesbacteria bacterium]